LQHNTDDVDFDTQIIIQLLHAGKRIKDIPIPTYYVDEISYVNGMKYAKDVVKDVVEYRMAAKGFTTTEWVSHPDKYTFQEGDGSSHSVMLELVSRLPASKVLDICCSDGMLADRVRAAGHYVTGLSEYESPGVRERTDAFIQADLAQGIPVEAGSGYDLVIAGDILEHMARPALLLRDIILVLRPGGHLLLSVPNFAHWYPRGRVAFGAFGYDRRGILDETHMRFFTRSTLRRLVRACGFDVLEERTTGLPLDVVSEANGRRLKALRAFDKALVRSRPTLFGYQFVLRGRRRLEASRQVHSFLQVSTTVRISLSWCC
jgi:2-polyprenyl-3-methyl-5-hydroxy-6-metoxy-1,4-benzoquinol methylase